MYNYLYPDVVKFLETRTSGHFLRYFDDNVIDTFKAVFSYRIYAVLDRFTSHIVSGINVIQPNVVKDLAAGLCG